jgi:hypothetical protein
MEQHESGTPPNSEKDIIVNPNNEASAASTPFFSTSHLLILFAGLIIIFGGLGLYMFLSKTAKKTQSQTTGNEDIEKISTKEGEPNISYTQDQLLQISTTPPDTKTLPLGDNKYTTTTPKKGYIYLCDVRQGQGGAREVGNWVHGLTWDLSQKPAVAGNIKWPNAIFSDTATQNGHTISGNALPMLTTTGIFPIATSDPAYKYDQNPNKISSHTFSLALPKNPVYSTTPTCMGGEVGIMLNGVPLFNGFDADHRDAPAHEVQDSCDGHPQVSGEYHYHSLSRCIKDIKETTIIGYALDGFPITGPILSNGNYLSTNDLDECHGMTSEVMLDGKMTSTYHYVMTQDFPYSVSCFRGKPVSMQVISGQSQQRTTSSQSEQVGHEMGTTPQPPEEAFVVCEDKAIGANCSFAAPRGSVTGTCQTPPNSQSMVCVPTRSEENQGKVLPMQ